MLHCTCRRLACCLPMGCPQLPRFLSKGGVERQAQRIWNAHPVKEAGVSRRRQGVLETRQVALRCPRSGRK